MEKFVSKVRKKIQKERNDYVEEGTLFICFDVAIINRNIITVIQVLSAFEVLFTQQDNSKEEEA